MDKGNWLKKGFKLEPADNGSYVLFENNQGQHVMGKVIGFSNASDLMAFMLEEQRALEHQKWEDDEGTALVPQKIPIPDEL